MQQLAIPFQGIDQFPYQNYISNQLENKPCFISKQGIGTTYAVCEATGRNWIGMEIQNCDVIIERLTEGNLHYHKNSDYVEG